MTRPTEHSLGGWPGLDYYAVAPAYGQPGEMETGPSPRLENGLGKDQGPWGKKAYVNTV